MYEHKRHHLLPWPRFIRRASRHLLIGVVIVAIADGLAPLVIEPQPGWAGSIRF